MKINKYISDYFSIKKSDVFLVSFPKSGNTRFRMALGKYYQLLTENENTELTYDWVNQILPEIGRGNVSSARNLLVKNGVKSNLSPFFIKSHLKYTVLKFFLKSNSIIYIQRPNHETLMSYFDFARNRNSISTDVSFSEFLRDEKKGLHAFIKHIEDFNKKASVIIDYDELMADDISTIIGGLKSLNLRFNENLMKQAIIETRRNKVVNVKNKLDQLGYNFAERKKRKLNDYFNPKDIEFYNSAVKNTKVSPISI